MFAVVLVPDFALQAVLRFEPDSRHRPVALVDPTSPKPDLIQLTSAARASGVVEGLTASQAIARCANLIIKPRSSVQEKAATDALLQMAYAFSPNIEATAPGVCTMELKGLGLDTDAAQQRWSDRLLPMLTGLDLDARVGVAVTPSLALLAAHAARPLLVVRDSVDFVSALSIEALEPPPALREILERWGIHTVGALIALGKTDLAERLGPEIVALLDRISPAASRPLNLVAPPECFEEQMEFNREIETAEPLLFVLRRFVEQLVLRVGVLHLVIAELHLQLGLSSGAVYQRVFEIPEPTGSVDTLFRMLQTHLDTVRTDAPIVSLRLEATPCRPQTHQFGLFETTLKDPNQFAETIARLTALCGSDRVGTPILERSHRPDAFRMEAPDWGAAFSAVKSEGNVEHQTPNAERRTKGRSLQTFDVQRSAFNVRRFPLQEGPALRRFRPPLTAIIEFRDQRPSWLHSSIFNGAIIETRGPFVSSGDWWDANQWSRQEWDAQTGDGMTVRICKTNEGCFVEGIYD